MEGSALEIVRLLLKDAESNSEAKSQVASNRHQPVKKTRRIQKSPRAQTSETPHYASSRECRRWEVKKCTCKDCRKVSHSHRPFVSENSRALVTTKKLPSKKQQAITELSSEQRELKQYCTFKPQVHAAPPSTHDLSLSDHDASAMMWAHNVSDVNNVSIEYSPRHGHSEDEVKLMSDDDDDDLMVSGLDRSFISLPDAQYDIDCDADVVAQEKLIRERNKKHSNELHEQRKTIFHVKQQTVMDRIQSFQDWKQQTTLKRLHAKRKQISEQKKAEMNECTFYPSRIIPERRTTTLALAVNHAVNARMLQNKRKKKNGNVSITRPEPYLLETEVRAAMRKHDNNNKKNTISSSQKKTKKKKQERTYGDLYRQRQYFQLQLGNPVEIQPSSPKAVKYASPYLTSPALSRLNSTF